MTLVRSVWRWAVTSNERAVANARAASVECSQRMLERAEVEAYLARLADDRAAWTYRRASRQAR